MKKTLLAFITCLPLFIAGCSGPAINDKKVTLPAPGTVIATAEMPVEGDTLNHFTFSVKVIADTAISSGVYDIEAAYGPNAAQGKMNMPKGGETLKPILRKGDAACTFLIGFQMPGDTTFYDYFEVSSNKMTTKMIYLKAYTFK